MRRQLGKYSGLGTKSMDGVEIWEMVDMLCVEYGIKKCSTLSPLLQQRPGLYFDIWIEQFETMLFTNMTLMQPEAHS